MFHYHRAAHVCCSLLLIGAPARGESIAIAGGSTENLAAVRPVQQTGEVSVDRSPGNQPLDLGELVYATGIGVRA